MEQSNEQLVETVKVDPPKYFVWDHVSVALHVGNQVTLLFLLLTNNIISCDNRHKSV